MAAAASYHHPRAGRSNDVGSLQYNKYSTTSPANSPFRNSPSTSTASRLPSRPNDDSRAVASATSLSSARSYRRDASRTQLRSLDTSMSSLATTTTLPASTRSGSGHAKLHKRGGSASSLPGPPSPFQGAYSQFTTPFATNEESLPDTMSTPSMSAKPKIKPSMRKRSGADEEQGRIDLSKPTRENDRLAGLGIQETAARSASDVNFAHVGKRGTHQRTTSVGSQVSTGSGSFRPSQPFVHPMRQTPRPYTPPTGSSNASFVDTAEANEESDVVDDDFRLGPGFRTRRSVSVSSTPQIAPTPLSQSHTADDLGIVPKLTNRSETNLSIRSGKSTKSRVGRQRRDTDRSFDYTASPSSRTSFDKAFSFVSRKSDTDPQTRDERIRAARRKFEEKEASKDRKAQTEAIKRRETDGPNVGKKQEWQRRKSEADDRSRVAKPRPSASPGKRGRRDDEKGDGMFTSRSYDEYRPSDEASLPRLGVQAGASEKTSRPQPNKGSSTQGGWVKFSAWFQTRMLSCGKR